jgi:16S rRNA (guanine(966)-N(2))-methyltransferase RsmD
MRIVAGQFGSRRLLPVHDLDLRPTSDRLRETLFDVLGQRVAGSIFLDAYAGTGAVGIEALSRGARRAIFLERHAATLELIRKNLSNLGVEIESPRARAHDESSEAQIGKAEILTMDAIKALKHLAGAHRQADFLFADPPYAEHHRLESILTYAGESAVLAPTGLAIAEHAARVTLPAQFGNLRRIRVLEQGDSTLSFFSF